MDRRSSRCRPTNTSLYRSTRPHAARLSPQKPEQTFAQCALAAGKKNAGVLGLDLLSVAASAVPAGKGALSIGAAIIGSTTGAAAVGIGIAGNSAIGGVGATLGAGGHFTSNAMGIFDETVAAGVGAAKYLPALGTGIAVLGIGLDAFDALNEGGCFGGKGD